MQNNCALYFISLKFCVRLLVLFVQYVDHNDEDEDEEHKHQHHVQPDPHMVDHYDLRVSLLRVQERLRLNNSR